MKVLHSAALLNPPPGIVNQMLSEQRAANELGLDWDVRIYTHKSALRDCPIAVESRFLHAMHGRSFTKITQWWRLRRDYHLWLESQLNTYDIILIRYYVHDPFQRAFVRKASNKIFLVHHTLEAPELRSAGLKGKLRASLENFLAPGTIQAARGLICVTHEVLGYEKNRAKAHGLPGFVYPNGIHFRNLKFGSGSRSSVPSFLFVASDFSSWHGLDLLLEASSLSKESFRVHLIGNLSPKDLANAQKDSRFVIHGKKSQEEIANIAAECWISLSSFALFRQNMHEACTLKVREALMMGLPVYAGYREMFPEDFPFYRQGPCNVSRIIKFAKEISKFDRNVVAETSRIHIDKKYLLSNAHRWLSSFA
jgi:glycosyltransferase involved in cell wall biosynthesis